jgi:hypothetical protein
MDDNIIATFCLCDDLSKALDHQQCPLMVCKSPIRPW